MNRYGQQARAHCEKWLPATMAAIGDPETYFSMLGLAVADEIDQLAQELAATEPASTDYLENLGRLQMARFTAEEVVLRERVLLAPEATTPTSDTSVPDPTGATDYPSQNLDQDPELVLSLPFGQTRWLAISTPSTRPALTDSSQ